MTFNSAQWPRHRLRALLGLLILTWCAVGHAAEPPLPLFNAEYSLKRNGVILGKSKRSLSTAPGGNYVYSTLTYATGLIAWFVKDKIKENSVWHFDGTHLRPLEYVYSREGGSKTRNIKLAFDWQHHTVVNSIDGDPWRMEIPPDAQDKLVYQLSIMYDLQQGKRKLGYNIADGGKMKNYQFEIQGEEVLNTPMGKIKTVRIQRIGDQRDTTVWCAPQFGYLPVRLEQQDTDGAELAMQLTSVNGIPKK